MACPLTFGATGLPPGLAIDPATGMIAGFIPYHSKGVYPVTLSASDGALTSTLGFTWTVRQGFCNPFAQDDSATTPLDTAVTIPALDNDITPSSCGPAPFGLVAFSSPLHGSAVFDNSAKGGHGSFIYTPAPGFVGVDTFTYSIRNNDGSSDNVTATVTVTVRDTTPPVITVPANITIEATGPNGAVVTFAATATDLVDGPTPVTCAPIAGSTFALGSTTVACSASDASGNAATAMFAVTVRDTTRPVITVPASITAEAVGPNGAAVPFTSTATDLVDGPTVVTCVPASGSTFPIGTTTVSCNTADSSGNPASATFTVTVHDTTPPVITVPANIIAEATGPNGAALTFVVSAHDAVDGSTMVSCSAASNSLFGIGTTFVICFSSDSHGNRSTNSFTVTVRDTTPPTLSLPANFTTPATSSAGAPVTFTASATDIVDVTVPVVCTPASGSVVPIGTTTVSCVATDHANNARAGTFTVTVPMPPPAGSPVVTNPGNQVSYLGDLVHLPIVAVDPNGDPLIFLSEAPTSSPLPLGLSIDRQTGVIRGRPTQPGLFTVTLRVTDQHTPPVEVTFIWTVLDHHRPTLGPVPDQTSVAGVPDSLPLDGATVPAGGTLTYTASGLPVGLSINPTSGLISGSPTLANTTMAPALVTVTVQDSDGVTASRTFRWRVLDPNGAELEVAVSARGPQGAQAPQRVSVVVTITNHGPQHLGNAGSPHAATAHIEVPPNWRGVAWTCSLQPPGPAGSQPNSQVLFPSGQNGSVDLNVSLGPHKTLTCGAHGPTGDLSVDAVATVSAPITPADPYLANNIATVHYPEIAAPGAHAPSLLNPGDQQSIEGDDASLQLAASDPDGDPLAFGLVTGVLPKGLHLRVNDRSDPHHADSVSAGDYPITIAVSDGATVVRQSFVWHVTARTVTLVNPGPQLDAAGRPIRLDLQVADRNHNPIVMTAWGLPEGLALRSSPDSRQWWIEGQATDAAIGEHAVTLTASSGGPSITRAFGWTIGPNLAPTLVNPGAQSTAGGQTVSLQLRASDPYGDRVTYGVGLFGLPPGLSLDSVTGLITGTVPFGVAGLYFSGVTASVGSQTFQPSVSMDDHPKQPADAGAAAQVSSPPRDAATGLALSGADPDGNFLAYWHRARPGAAARPLPRSGDGPHHRRSAAAGLLFRRQGLVHRWCVRPGLVGSQVPGADLTWKVNRKPVIEDHGVQTAIMGGQRVPCGHCAGRRRP